MNEAITAIITVILTAVFTYLAARQKFRDDLQSAYDASLRSERTAAYRELWKTMQVLAKYARPEPVTPNRLETLSSDLRKWYFEIGGLFLTDNSRDAYFALQEEISAEVAAGKSSPSEEISANDFEAVRKRGSTLRTNLCSDLRSRIQPQLELDVPANG
jgi:hypothetical protein